MTEIYSEDQYPNFIQLHPSMENTLPAQVLKSGYQTFTQNFNTKAIAALAGSTALVGTVNEKEHDNSPLCSPYQLFCLYPKKKLSGIANPWLKSFLNFTTSLLAWAFYPTQFDKVIQLNNKPCDAITYPVLSMNELKKSLDKLQEIYPSHTIIFPRIDKITSPDLCSHLESLGFLMVPTRGVHLFYPDGSYLKRNHTKKDFNLFKKTPYSLVSHEQLNLEDLKRIHDLYRNLFVEKHGEQSPQLTQEFFLQSHANQWYTFFAFRNPHGIIDAFFSYEIRGNVMACGPLGYDTSIDQEIGLYRMLFAHSLKIAHENGYLFNFGGANDEFKIKRGSQKEIGYTAVYCKHLPLYRRLPWLFLEQAGKRWTVKIIQHVKI